MNLSKIKAYEKAQRDAKDNGGQLAKTPKKTRPPLVPDSAPRSRTEPKLQKSRSALAREAREAKAAQAASKKMESERSIRTRVRAPRREPS